MSEPEAGAKAPASARPSKAEAEQSRAAPAPGNVWCRITKFGDKKVFTGETDVTIKGHDNYDEAREIFPRHRTGAIIELPRKIAEAQEELGHLEIQED